MHKIAAELRHRELTQEIYNIGDEVAEYIEHLIESIADWERVIDINLVGTFNVVRLAATAMAEEGGS